MCSAARGAHKCVVPGLKIEIEKVTAENVFSWCVEETKIIEGNGHHLASLLKLNLFWHNPYSSRPAH